MSKVRVLIDQLGLRWEKRRYSQWFCRLPGMAAGAEYYITTGGAEDNCCAYYDGPEAHVALGGFYSFEDTAALVHAHADPLMLLATVQEEP